MPATLWVCLCQSRTSIFLSIGPSWMFDSSLRVSAELLIASCNGKQDSISSMILLLLVFFALQFDTQIKNTFGNHKWSMVFSNFLPLGFYISSRTMFAWIHNLMQHNNTEWQEFCCQQRRELYNCSTKNNKLIAWGHSLKRGHLLTLLKMHSCLWRWLRKFSRPSFLLFLQNLNSWRKISKFKSWKSAFFFFALFQEKEKEKMLASFH